MKRGAAIYLVVALLGAAVFGVLMTGKYNHSVCLASLIEFGVCPEESNLAFINFHLTAFKKFSQAVFGNLTLPTFILLFLGLIFLAASFLSRRQTLLLPRFSGAPDVAPSPPLPLVRENFLAWLAFHENSPSAFTF